MQQTEPNLESYRYWARLQFNKYKSCVAYIESVDDKGDKGIGTCFHVGEGVFVTARHVVEHRTDLRIGFDDDSITMDLMQRSEYRSKENLGNICITVGPYFHPDDNVDIACFSIDIFPAESIPLGGHLNDWLGQYELVLHKTLILGYPPIPLSARPVLVASLGEINALTDLYLSKHPHFLISTMARGGFSGGPALVAYNELNIDGGTAALGVITQSLTANDGVLETGYMAVLTVEPIYTCLEAHGMLPKAQEIIFDERDFF
ncbi:S1 family peptidase [Pseudomonas sp. Z4-20]|uniref:S1 family peptidase n=1 Tax=Pseudomonas sp. Z4-20 TaxID=2817414 RepID=UPI003DA85C04